MRETDEGTFCIVALLTKKQRKLKKKRDGD